MGAATCQRHCSRPRGGQGRAFWKPRAAPPPLEHANLQPRDIVARCSPGQLAWPGRGCPCPTCLLEAQGEAGAVGSVYAQAVASVPFV